MGRVTLALLAGLCLVSCRTESTSAKVEPRTMPSGMVHTSGPILSYADVVDQVAPAVVTIRSLKRVHNRTAPHRRDLDGGLSGGPRPSYEQSRERSHYRADAKADR